MKKKIADLIAGDVVGTEIGEREIQSVSQQPISTAYDIKFTNGDFSLADGRDEIEVLRHNDTTNLHKQN